MNYNKLLIYEIIIIICYNIKYFIFSEEPFVNGHSIAPPLVVISQQHNQQQHQQQQLHQPGTPLNQNNNHNSLSPPSQSSASTSSFDMSRSRSSSISSTNLQQSTPPSISSISSTSSLGSQVVAMNGIYSHTILQNGGGDDSNQSSLNLSNISSGYLSGSSGNSSVGAVSLNLSTNNSVVTNSGLPNGSPSLTEQHQITFSAQSVSTGGRRRTTSTNSNG